MNNYLKHHGILGQKWGKKNGPPYPLDFNDLSYKERKQAKYETIRKGDIKTALNNKDHYTRQELEEVMSRYGTNTRLKDLNQRNMKNGFDKSVEIMNKIGTFGNAVGKAASGYNNVAKVMNGLFGTTLKTIDMGGNNKKKKNKKPFHKGGKR